MRALALSLLLIGCASTQVVHVSDLRLHPIGPPELDRKLDIPVYVSVDSQLPEPVTMGEGGMFGGSKIEAHEVASFVSKDFVQMLGLWFTEVHALEGGAAPPAGNVILLKARLASLSSQDVHRAGLDPAGTVRAVLDWRVDVSVPSQPGAGYAFKDRVEGSPSDNGERVVKGVLEAALARFGADFFGHAMAIRASARR